MVSPVEQPAPEGWVPAEHRFAGIDKRTIAPSLAVLLLAIFYAIVIPAIDHAVPYQEPIVAGDVIDLGSGELTFVPAVGWNLAKGVRTGNPRSPVPQTTVTQLTKGDTSFTVRTGKFNGSAPQLLAQDNKVNSQLDDARGLGSATRRISIATSTGQVGVMETYTGLEKQGFVAAFVVPKKSPTGERTPIGVVMVGIGSAESLTNEAPTIGAMIRSLKFAQPPERTSK